MKKIDSLWNDAKKAGQKGDQQGLLKIFEEILAIDPANVDAWRELGVARQITKDLPGARQAYEKCLEHAEADDGDRLSMLFALGAILLDLGEPAAALDRKSLLE
jgi:predicted TPR repeat methyltransferase